MRPHRIAYRLTAALVASGMILGPVAPALGQEMPGQGANGPEVSPPLRVGRLAWARGNVSYRQAGQSDWTPAVVNYPVAQGDSLWTAPGATAGLQVSDTELDLNTNTELDLDQLGDRTLEGTVPQGEVYVRVRSLAPQESYTLVTPRGTVVIATPGRYAVAAGSTESPTLVTVFDGAARIEGPQTLDLGPHQSAQLNGDGQQVTVQLSPALRDAFLDSMLARERPRPVLAVAPPPLVQLMPGGADLADYGQWEPSPDYGPVWYPQVAPGWVPYREGHWAYIPPWGWTWVDDDPWGFAPFHYGRWVEIGPRWAWVPGVATVSVSFPVYAPALVTFFDVGTGFAAGVAVGALLSGSVGWVPLGPREPWHPWFRASPRYVRDVNIVHVTNINQINNVNITNVTINRFHNARAATMVPAGTLLASRQVRGAARPVPAALLNRARPVLGRPPLPPTQATAGVTPALAQRLRIAPAPAALRAPAPRLAAGPAPHPVAATAGPRARLPALAPPKGRPVLPPGAAPRGPQPAAGPGARPIGAARPGAPVSPRTPGVSPAARAPGAPLAPRAPGAGLAPRAPGAGLAPRAPGATPALRPPGATPALRPPGATPTAPGVRAPRSPTTPQPAIRQPLPASRGPQGRPQVNGGRVGPAAPRGAPGAAPGVPALRAPGTVPQGVQSRPGAPRSGPTGPRVIVPQPSRTPTPTGGAPRPATPNVVAPAYRAAPRPATPSTPAYRPAPAPAPRPTPAYRPAPAPVYRPPTPAYRPPTPAYRPPTPAYRPPAPAYRPPTPAYRPPPAPAYHPPAPAYRPPPAPAYHPPPAPAARPAPAQRQPPPNEQNRKRP